MAKLTLVTGANGFTGNAIARALLARKDPIRVLVRSEEKGRKLEALGAQVSIGDLRDPASLKRATTGVSKVFHIAAAFRDARQGKRELHEINSEGTRDLIEAAAANGVGFFIHCSTTGVLGNVKNPPADETAPYAPCDDYQVSKVQAEVIVLNAFESGKIRGVIIRPAMIYGPGDLRFLKLIKGVITGRFVVLGDGKVLTHFVYIDDLVQGFLLAGDREDLSGQVYTIAGDEILPMNDVVQRIAKVAGCKPPPWKVPLGPVRLLAALCESICVPLGIQPPLHRRRVDFFVKNRAFDCTKARRDLGYEPHVGFDEGVRRTMQWYRDSGHLQ